MGEFTDDTAFRVLLVITLFGIIFWTTYGHIMALYEDSLVQAYGELAWDEGIKMAHLHGLSNTFVVGIIALALPLIVSIGKRLKTLLATVSGLSFVFWNLGYTYAAFTTTAPTDEAFESAKTFTLNYFMIPLSWLASITAGILFIALLYDLARKKPKKT